MKGKFLYLNRSEVESLVSYSDTLEICEKAFKAFEQGTSIQEARVLYLKPGVDLLKEAYSVDRMIIQPSYSKSLNVAGVKAASIFPSNYEKGIPAIQIMVYLNDTETGVPLAIMSGNVTTELRTPGNSAVAAKYLARKDSSSIAIIGCGHQGRGHLLAMKELFDIKDIRIHARSKESMEKYKNEMGGKLDINIKSANSPKDAVKGADIVCMVSTANEPLVFDEWIEPGCFVSAVHSFSDFDIKFSKTADKYVIGEPKTDIPMLKQRFKKFSEDDIDATIGEIILGKKVGRTSDKERILFGHPGIVSLPDLMIASLAYQRAKERGMGVELEYS